jgi:hypothetical protein
MALAAKIHLDPWTDIVNVGWPQTYTHVAFDLQLFDGQITGTTNDYPSLDPGDPPGSFFTTSVATAGHRVNIQGRYRMRTSGTTQIWSGAQSSDLVISGFPDDGNTSKAFSATYTECDHWSPINGTLGPPTFTGNQAMFGFDSYRVGDSTITSPITSTETFETSTAAALVFHTHPLTACVPTSPSTVLDDTTTERVEVNSNVLTGVSLTYRSTPCTIIGLWTPLLGLTPNVSISPVQVPKRLFVLASIDS